ncbi:prokineticin receptor 2-like [Branchiostoma floridae x Branchiostoma belcheri]
MSASEPSISKDRKLNISMGDFFLDFDMDVLIEAYRALLRSNDTDSSEVYRNLVRTTFEEDPPGSVDGAVVVIGILYSLIMLVCGIGNLLFLFVLLYYKQTRSTTNLLIGNLTLSDFLVAMICLPFNMDYHVIHSEQWLFGPAMCAVVNFLTFVSLYVSTHALLAIAIDRYFVVQDAQRRRLHVGWTSLVIWVVAVGFAVPCVLYSDALPYPSSDKVYCGVLWPISLQHVYKGYHIFLLIGEFLLPVVVMSVFYSFVVCKVWRRQFPGQRNASHDRIQSRSRKKTFRLFALFVMFVLCWSPYHVYAVMRDFYFGTLIKISTSPNMFYMAQAIAMSNSLINTVVYVVFNDNITKYIKILPKDSWESFRRMCRRRSRAQSREPSRRTRRLRSEDFHSGVHTTTSRNGSVRMTAVTNVIVETRADVTVTAL